VTGGESPLLRGTSDARRPAKMLVFMKLFGSRPDYCAAVWLN
jgi:hypothetical protein